MKKILPFLIITLFLSPLVLFASPQPPPTVDPWEAIERITNLVFGALIAVALIFIIVAAFFFVTAAGSEDGVKKARNMLMWAIVGIVVAVLAKGAINYLKLFLEGSV